MAATIVKILDELDSRKYEELDQLTRDMVKDESLRLDVGYELLKDARFQRVCFVAMDRLMKQLEDDDDDEDRDQTLVLVSKLLKNIRNTMIQSKVSQEIFRENLYLEKITSLLTCLSRRTMLDSSPSSAAASESAESSHPYCHNCLRFSVQSIGNAIVKNKKNAELFWTAAFPEMFVQLFTCPDPSVFQSSLLVLYSCCLLDDDPTTLAANDNGGDDHATTIVEKGHRGNEVVHNRLLLECVLQQNVLTKYLETSLLFNYLFDRENSPVDLLPPPPPSSTTTGTQLWTREQVILFRFFQDYCEQKEPKILPDVEKLIDMYTYVNSQAASDPLSLSIADSILASLAALSGYDIFDRTAVIQHETFIESVVQILLLPSTTTSGRVGVKCSALGVLGNCAYQTRSLQDRIRDAGGLEAILNHSGIDETQPFQREWSIVAIRNLCENNVSNQNHIQNLKLQQRL